MSELTVDTEHRLTWPARDYAGMPFQPGTRFITESFEDGVRLHVAQLDARQAYLEVTARCNLSCSVCVRQVWREAPGEMTWETFQAVIEGLRAFSQLERVTLGGYGEPPVHPRLPEMLELASTLGGLLTVTTNGLLLDEEVANHILKSRADWVMLSLDAVHTQAHTQARVPAGVERVVANAQRLSRLADRRRGFPLNLGMAFVATRCSRDQLPLLRELARDVNASSVLVSNLLPYTPAMCEEILDNSDEPLALPMNWPVKDNDQITWGRMDLPRMKWGAWQQCRFVLHRALVVGWDGGVSPRYPLMHSYPYYIYGRLKNVSRYVLGNVQQQSLADIWTSAEYVRFRAKVRDFRFMWCVDCGLACDCAERNEDCLGNVPSCADCLCAQGIIRCP
jgi:MoaA/NifB/PqqE/SkfB family radical SAM enzyme